MGTLRPGSEREWGTSDHVTASHTCKANTLSHHVQPPPSHAPPSAPSPRHSFPHPLPLNVLRRRASNPAADVSRIGHPRRHVPKVCATLLQPAPHTSSSTPRQSAADLRFVLDSPFVLLDLSSPLPSDTEHRRSFQPCARRRAIHTILLLQHEGTMMLNRRGITAFTVRPRLRSDEPYLLRLTGTSLSCFFFFAGQPPTPPPHSASTPGIFQWLETPLEISADGDESGRCQTQEYCILPLRRPQVWI